MAKCSRTKRCTHKKHHRRHRTRKNMRGGMDGPPQSDAILSQPDPDTSTLSSFGTKMSNKISDVGNQASSAVSSMTKPSTEKKSMFSFLGFGGRRRRRRKSSHRKK